MGSPACAMRRPAARPACGRSPTRRGGHSRRRCAKRRFVARRLVLGRIGIAQERDHPARRIDGDLAIELGQFVDAVDRLSDMRVHEQQHALQHVGRQRHRLGGDHDRLAEFVLDDPARLLVRNAERAFEFAHDGIEIVLQGGGFQPPDVLALERRGGRRRRPRRQVEVDQDQPALDRAGGIEQLGQFERGLVGGSLAVLGGRLRHVIRGFAPRSPPHGRDRSRRRSLQDRRPSAHATMVRIGSATSMTSRASRRITSRGAAG